MMSQMSPNQEDLFSGTKPTCVANMEDFPSLDAFLLSPVSSPAPPSPSTNHPCSLCPGLFASKKNLHRHLAQMHGPKRHLCHRCMHSFARMDGLQKHVCTASKPGPTCRWSLQELYILLSSNVVTYLLNRTPKAIERKRNSLRKSASCPSCKLTYRNVDELMAHILNRCKATRIIGRAPRTKPASIKAVTASRVRTRNV
ncbi:hypothetical protein EDB81DRAFT_763472 [Dactylonectria macrodidyma]|uniref:C2H2-type domain-containing protein n=1 Tax=Dactylonectria macrodidyma TaxID=307937 RepID=A0A9P9ITM6_9HYPO|nr:hypothetical protein EDB81DRAFT_763472 [Dactylonectria macrodidyma]